MKNIGLLLVLLSIMNCGNKEIQVETETVVSTSVDIFEAIKNGELAGVKYFILNGVDVNSIDNSDTAILMRALWGKQFEIVKFLVDNGADINTTNSQSTVLIEAAYSGCTEIVKLLIDAGANIDTKDWRGLTALMKASEQNHIEM